jgi:aldehyde dehydrogenase (NAD+)
MKSLFSRLREAHHRSGPPSYAHRKANLERLLKAVRTRQDEIIAALKADFGKPEAETLISEVLTTTETVKHILANLKRWMKPRTARPSLMMAGTVAWVRPEPMGVVLVIAPWNYPFNLSIIPLLYALAAGNRVMVKPSELTPHTSTLVADLIGDLFPSDEVVVVEGGMQVAQELLALPFDHIFFTGSPRVGKIVMEAAAKHLTSVTLELGGKSPCIVDATADLDLAARKLAWGKCLNAGQTCIAPDYLLVHEAVHDALIDRLKAQFDARITTSDDFARIVNETHRARITGYLDDARAKGATLVEAGADVGDGRIRPTIILNATPDMACMQEEIFGPVLPVMRYTDITQVLEQVRSLPDPLSLYIFSTDAAFTERVVAGTSAGGTCLNEVLAHFGHPNLPFGGVNGSGIGKSHGEYGFNAFSNERAMLKPRFGIDTFRILLPPYKQGLVKALRVVIGR